MLALTAAPASRPTLDRYSVANAASLFPQGLPGGALAPGGVFVIRGLGLAGATVRVTSGASAWEAVTVKSTGTEVRALLPAAAPPGFVYLAAAVEGIASEPVMARVLPASFGIFTVDGSGRGAALDGIVRRGARVVVTGTGLGSGADPRRVEIFVGGMPSRVIATGRRGVGIDTAEFEIPAGAPRGCDVPVQARTGGSVVGNTATLAVEPEPGACADADRYRQAARGGGRGAFILPFHARLHYDFTETGSADFAGDALLADFREGSDSGNAGALATLPPGGSCAVYGLPVNWTEAGAQVRASLLGNTERLDAGELRIGGRSVRRAQPDGEVYFGVFGGSLPNSDAPPLPLVLRPGIIHVAGTGAKGVSAFGADVPVPDFVNWSGRNGVRTVDRGRDFEIRWRLRNPRQRVFLAGVNIDQPTRSAGGFVCSAGATETMFRIPAYVLQTLPPSRTKFDQSIGFLFLATFAGDGEVRRDIAGVDVVLTAGAAFDGRSVRFR